MTERQCDVLVGSIISDDLNFVTEVRGRNIDVKLGGSYVGSFNRKDKEFTLYWLFFKDNVDTIYNILNESDKILFMNCLYRKLLSHLDLGIREEFSNLEYCCNHPSFIKSHLYTL